MVAKYSREDRKGFDREERALPSCHGSNEGTCEDAGRGSSVFVTGYAKLPEGITATEIFRVVGIGLEVDREAGEILVADCTLAMEVGREFFRKVVQGYRLLEDFDLLVEEVEDRYQGNAQKALVTALRIARDKFRAFCDKTK